MSDIWHDWDGRRALEISVNKNPEVHLKSFSSSCEGDVFKNLVVFSSDLKTIVATGRVQTKDGQGTVRVSPAFYVPLVPQTSVPVPQDAESAGTDRDSSASPDIYKLNYIETKNNGAFN